MKLSEWRDQYHASHECNPAKCVCKCGCDVQLGCTALGKLCSVCQVRYLRDDCAHGFAEPESARVTP